MLNTRHEGTKAPRHEVHRGQSRAVSARFQRPFDVAQGRRGSVLLIVVVLLLIMAILGATYLASTRTDRITSSQDVANSQIDSLVDGASSVATSYIVNSLFALNNYYGNYQYAYRGTIPVSGSSLPLPTGTYSNVSAYNHFDVPIYTTAQYTNNQGDVWLADRFPQGPAATTAWEAITAPLNDLGASGVAAFEDPTVLSPAVPQWNPYTSTPFGLPLKPTTKLVAGVTYPALETQSGAIYVAGDADGDGIADCGLVRLPGVYSDELTYYAGIRIIDNNSAININTAWNYQSDYSATGTATPAIPNTTALFPSLFPSAVDLQTLVDAGDSTYSGAPANLPTPQALNYFRFNFLHAGGLPPTNTANANQVMAIDDFGNPHKDFGFSTLGDAMYHQMSRRLGNPGYLDQPTAAKPADAFNTFGNADAAALAYHFGLVNPREYPGIISGSILYANTPLDNVLGVSTFTNAPNSSTTSTTSNNAPTGYPLGWSSYVPNDTSNWYTEQFAPTNGHRNLRPLLVTRNAVSNAAPTNYPATGDTTPTLGVVNPAMVPYGDRGRWQPNVLYYAGDCVTYSANPAAAVAALPTIPGNQFSGFFFARQNNTNVPPTGLPTLTTSAAIDPNWCRPTQWPFFQPGQSSFTGTTAAMRGDYVYFNGNFYYPTGGAPSAASLPDQVGSGWTLWTPPASAMCLKASVNTAGFPELFRAYCNVMTAVTTTGAMVSPFDANGFSTPLAPAAENIYYGSHYSAQTATPPFAAAALAVPATFHTEAMFRSPVRDNPARAGFTSGMIFDPYQVVQLRAAIAAVNTENIRSQTEDVLARQIPLNLNIDGNLTSVNVVVYGNQPQPFITEVYGQTNISAAEGGLGPNPHGYFAVELYNPYGFPIPMANWQVASLSRTTKNKTLTPIYSFPNNATALGSGAYILLENFQATGASDALYRPGSTGLPPKSALPYSIYVAGLDTVNLVGNELVILKPRAFAGTASNGDDGSYSWNDKAGSAAPNLVDMVPVDSFDFSGMQAPSATLAQSWHYMRANNPNIWQFVYPGRYDATVSTGGYQQGTWQAAGTAAGDGTNTWNPTLEADPWLATGPTPAPNFGAANSLPSYGGPTPPLFPIQLNYAYRAPTWIATFAKPTAGGPNSYPFGGFARNGDILQVPFVGAYRIEDLAGNLLELNSVSMDTAFAEDTDINDDPTATPTTSTVEQIGRFCPLVPSPNPSGINDGTRTGPTTRYGWARSIFDYLTVQDPRDDYLPNADPATYPAVYQNPGYQVRTPNTPLSIPTYPTPVANSDANQTSNQLPGGSTEYTSAANTESENTQGVEGLMNINTAPLPVLEALPLVVSANGTVDAAKTATLAQNIITYRQGAPFTSLFDLNAVPGFQNGSGDITGFNGSSTVGQGNLTPGSAVPNQFDELYLQIARLSNLITTRSDTFTVYVVVEGWQSAGTTSAKLVVTRRAAFIVDRNSVTPTSRVVRTVTVPND